MLNPWNVLLPADKPYLCCYDGTHGESRLPIVNEAGVSSLEISSEEVNFGSIIIIQLPDIIIN